MPIGYTTYYGGSFADLRNQQALVAAQEEAAPEGALPLLEIELAEAPHPDTLVEVNNQLLSAGVPPWEGYSSLVLADATNPRKVYVAWTKGISWMPIIIGILILLLPTILGGILWFLIPQPVKDMIIMLGFLAIMVPIMGVMR